MPDTRTLKRALRGLALGTASRSVDGPRTHGRDGDRGDDRRRGDDLESRTRVGIETLLRRGAASLVDAEAAAAFRAAGGVSRLDAAAADAERRDADALARRCRRVTDAFARYRRAAEPTEGSDPSPSGREARPVTRTGPGTNHFRSAHGTPLSGGGQPGDR